VHYIPQLDTLIVGEDSTSGHQNDVVWQVPLGGPGANSQAPTVSGPLVRILSTPYGAESTAIYNYVIGSNMYLTATVQHPYGETDYAKADEPESTGKAGWIGYFGPYDVATLQGNSAAFRGIFPATTNEEKHQVLGSSELMVGGGNGGGSGPPEKAEGQIPLAAGR
jgi:hypothetical protein